MEMILDWNLAGIQQGQVGAAGLSHLLRGLGIFRYKPPQEVLRRITAGWLQPARSKKMGRRRAAETLLHVWRGALYPGRFHKAILKLHTSSGCLLDNILREARPPVR